MAMENLAVDGANAAVDARKWGIGPESKRESSCELVMGQWAMEERERGN
jgi:hypothetical protein